MGINKSVRGAAMSAKVFSRGYACEKCVKEFKKKGKRWLYAEDRRKALYVREKNGFVFCGRVLCESHGVQKAWDMLKSIRENSGCIVE